MYVLDTNTLIYYFKGQGNVKEKLLSTSPKDIAIPSIVLYELEIGIAKSSAPKKRSKQLNDMLSVVNILPFAENEARATAKIRAQLEKKGTPIEPYDYLIAGTALSNNGILVTNNTKEFNRVKGLKLENWFSINDNIIGTNKMIKIYEAANGLEAKLILDLLEQNDLSARIDGEYLQGGIGDLQASGMVRVMINELHYKQGKKLIKQWENYELDDSDAENN